MGRFIPILIIFILCFLYLYLRLNFVFKQKLPKERLRLGQIIVIAAIAGLAFLLLVRVFDPFGREGLLPGNLYYPLWFGMIYLAQTIPYLLLADLIFWGLRLGIGKKREALKSVHATVLIGVLGFFFLYIPLRMWYDDSQVHVVRMSYEKEDLAKPLEGFKIALISDIQLDGFTDEEEVLHYLDKVNELDPHLTFIAGDFITGTPDYIQPIGQLLPKLKSTYGVFGCAGDHDHWAYRGGDWKENEARSIREVRESIAKANVPMLIDVNQEFLIGDAVIKLTSTNQTYAADVSDAVLAELTKDTTKYDLKIFLNHQPTTRLINKAESTGYDLFLTGHTHGGQVRFVYPFFTFTTAEMGHRNGYLRGEYRLNKLLIAVSSGLGMSIAPVRYNSTPDIVLIELQKG